jgi:2-polyprenyl-6-methoxyphenol hydroxylase-like FAD-dependent oxidoreductase
MTAALLMAKFGISSTILERNKMRDPIGSKALCMQRDVLDVLERVGCGDHLMSEGVTWTVGRTYYRDRELFEITFPEIGENHYPPFVNIGQDRTEYWLERAIEAEPLIDLRYGERVSAIAQSPDGVTVTTNHGTFEADYAIGADGSRSTVRDQMDVTFDGRSFDDLFLICDIRADLDFANERRFFFDPEWNPDRQVLIHPQRDSVWRIDWQVPPSYSLEADEESGGLDGRIRKIVGDQPYEIVWSSLYRFHQKVASSFRDGRVFLAGDAAHVMSPFGARGLNSGVQDAENLAWKLAYVLRGWAAPEVLDTYTIERKAAAEENLRVTGATMDFLVPGTPEQWDVRRRALESAIDNPDAPNLVDSGQLAAPFDYADSPLTTAAPNSASGELHPGMLFPDATVRIEGLPEIDRLRLLFGGPLIALTTGDANLLATADVAPLEVFELAEIDVNGIIAASTHLPANSTAVIRPDGHLAAIVPATAQALAEAGRKAMAHHP